MPVFKLNALLIPGLTLVVDTLTLFVMMSYKKKIIDPWQVVNYFSIIRLEVKEFEGENG